MTLPTTVISDTGTFGRRFFLPITSDHKRLQLTNNFTYSVRQATT